MAIVNGLIGNVDTTLLTVPAGKRYAITNILVCNNEPINLQHEEHGTTNFDMHIVKVGEPKSAINMVVRSLPMPASETFSFDSERIIMEEGDTITFLGESPTVLSATISYMEV
jgi:hypothetical protein